LITIFFGRAAQFILALLMMRVGTTLLTPQEMGRVSLVLTSVGFFAMFLVYPVGMFINRRLHTWQNHGVARYYLLRYTAYLLAVALFTAASLPLFYAMGIVKFGLSSAWLILLICGTLIFNTINQTSIPSLNLLGHTGRFIFLSNLTLLASFAAAILLVKIQGAYAQNWLLGLLIGQALIGLLGTRALFAVLKPPSPQAKAPVINRAHVRTLFNYAWPLAIAAGLTWVQGQGYRYLIGNALGLDQLGLFVAGYAISAGTIAGVESVLTTYFQPRLYRTVNDNPQPEQQALAWQRYAGAVIPSLILTVMYIIMMAPQLTRLFLGHKFQSAGIFVMWGALAEAGRVLIGVYSLIAHVRMRTRWLLIPNIIGALLSIGACLLLIPHFGGSGAGIGLVCSGAAVVLTMHLLFARHAGGGIAWRPLISALLLGGGLWASTLLMRNLMVASDWRHLFAVLLLTGLAELGLQYLVLHKHLAAPLQA